MAPPIVGEKIMGARSAWRSFQAAELLQPFVEGQQELKVQKSKISEADSALAAIIEERAHTGAEYRRERFGELVEAERKARGLRDDVVKAQRRTQLQELVAPVDGTVQQVSVHTVGGVVTPAQVLAIVVPVDSHLEIEAMVSNRDIGFVHAGQEAEIKVDTFNFTRYGLLHGKVLDVSQDAITRQKPEDKSGDKSFGAEPTSSEPKQTGKKLYHVEVQDYEKGDVKSWSHGCPSHGIALTHDEKELWLADCHNSAIHIFDNTLMPPKQTTSLKMRDCVGWISMSLDGRYAYSSTGEVIDVNTKRIVAALTDEVGRQVRSEKVLDVYIANGKVTRVGDQFGVGMEK